MGSVGAAGLPWLAGWCTFAGGAAAGSSLLGPSTSWQRRLLRPPVGQQARGEGRETGEEGDRARGGRRREMEWEGREMGGGEASAREGRSEERGEGVGVSKGKLG